MMKKYFATLFVSVFLCVSTMAQDVKPPLMKAIRMSDLKRDMIEMSADHFRGREAGTIDELTGAVWLANKLRNAGMEPAGENGTYFQFFDMYRRTFQNTTHVSIGGKSYRMFKDVFFHDVSPAKLNVPILYLGDVEPEDLNNIDVKGKAVVIKASGKGIVNNISLFEKRYPAFVVGKYYEILNKKGAAAIILIADKMVEDNWDIVVADYKRGRTGVKNFRDEIIESMPVFWFHQNEELFFKNNTQNLVSNIDIQLFKYPSVNVIGKIEGTDSKLKNEYLLFSGHHDYIGVRHPLNGDSIMNGADDNASICAAMLAMGRAFKKQPSKRSALFVFHGAEEFFMLGSRHYAEHPTVPFNSIVGVLNGDLIAGNDVNTAALLGAYGVHKTSDAMVIAALDANNEGPKFKIDESWDSVSHPEYFFYRSDHIPYARKGIPVIFYTSMLTQFYHTPLDDVDHISFEKLYKMTEWIYRTGWKISNMPVRPTYDKKTPFER